MSRATPPPALLVLGLLTHSYPFMRGGFLPSLVSARPMMWALTVWAADIRLVILPVIPSGLVYRKFSVFLIFDFLLFSLFSFLFVVFFGFLVF